MRYFIGCTIIGCSKCQDRDYTCGECKNGLLPTLDQYQCGSMYKLSKINNDN